MTGIELRINPDKTLGALVRKGEGMDLTCHKCGFKADYLEFAYLCKNGCPACGESDLRTCPRCGARCVFSRAESLEEEDILMDELAGRLSKIPRTQDPLLKEEARAIIAKLEAMNMRWNIQGLHDFLKQRLKELFY